ncbi:uncharacterized protein KRP23_14444 [Phytophthora ramorum]|uniref:uncharacterized protein n=1 Tax=Phytophthora ramorum TaxID=164328 RepID=UPI003098BDD0|nr:hypothetical protein KRP23_14444 [Phytophthora ramorum]
MRLSYAVLIVIVVTFVASCNASSVAKVETSSLSQPRDTPLNGYRFLRTTPAEDEERAIDFKKVFDVKKWFGLEKKNFSMKTMKKMLQNEQFKTDIFKKWDKFTVETVKLKIGQKTLNDKRFAELLVEYVKHGRTYGRWG